MAVGLIANLGLRILDTNEQRGLSEQLRERIKALVNRADAITRESEVLKQHSNELREEARKLLDELHGSGDGSAK